MSKLFGSFIVLWACLLLALIVIGGYFMLRKFLKSMPKQDGKSELDWQDYYIRQTQTLWTDETRQLLNELVQPVPQLFRDVARRTIAAKIGEIALSEQAEQMTRDLIIKGYILATPARDHTFLIAHLKRSNIDFEPYRKYLSIK